MLCNNVAKFINEEFFMQSSGQSIDKGIVIQKIEKESKITEKQEVIDRMRGEGKIELKQFLVVPAPIKPMPLKSQNNFTTKWDWLAVKKLFSYKTPECLYSHLLELSKVLKDADEKKAISLDDPTTKKNIKDILDTLPPATSTLDLVPVMQSIIKENWQASYKEVKEKFTIPKTAENLSEKLIQLSVIIKEKIGTLNYFTDLQYVQKIFGFIQQLLGPILKHISPDELDLIKKDNAISNFLKICIEIICEGKEPPNESKNNLEGLSEVEKRFKALKMYVRMADLEGTVHELYNRRLGIWNQSIFKSLDQDIEKAICNFPYVIEILRRMRHGVGQTAYVESPVRMSRIEVDNLLTYVYTDNFKTKAWSWRQDQDKDFIVEIYVKKCQIEQLIQLSKTGENAFPMVTKEPETLIDKLLLYTNFSIYPPDRIQQTFDFLIAKDICVKAIFSKENLSILMSDPLKQSFIEENFIYLLRAAAIYKKYNKDHDFGKMNSAIGYYQQYTDTANSIIKEGDITKVDPRRLIEKFNSSSSWFGGGIKIPKEIMEFSLKEMLNGLREMQKKYLLTKPFSDENAIKLNYIIFLLSEYANAELSAKNDMTAIELISKDTVKSLPTTSKLKEKKEDSILSEATEGLIKELKKPTPSIKKVVVLLKQGVNVAAMVDREVPIAFCLFKSFTTQKDIDAIKEAGGLSKDAKEVHVNWVKSQLLYAYLGMDGSTANKYQTSLSKFKEALSRADAGCYNSWTHYYKKDGFIVFFKTVADEKKFDSLLEYGLERIRDFECKDILQAVQALPSPPSSIKISSKDDQSLFGKSYSLTPEEITTFYMFRSQIIYIVFNLLNNKKDVTTSQQFFTALKSDLESYQKVLSTNPICKDLNEAYQQRILPLIEHKLKKDFSLSLG